jgi:lipoprotein-releasing system ATP-binding protein
MLFVIFGADFFMLSCSNITKKFGSLNVLRGVSLQVQKGEIVSLVGSSGAGKSTLMHILGTLEKPDSGEVMLNGQNVYGLSSKALARFRNQHIGFVFQFHHLLPEFTALENVCIPGWLGKRNKQTVSDRAKELLAMMGLQERMEHKPFALSGGEQQRVSVARALINQPDIIFADEPTGNLDSVNARSLHALFVELRKNLGQTFLIVTHNEELAEQSDRVIQMKDGLIAQ